MSMSIDGKIATKRRGPIKFTSQADSRRMAEIRADQDMVINGAATFRAFPFPLHVKGADLIARRLGEGLPEQPVSAVVSSKADIPRRTAWERAKTERWLFCGKKSPAKTVASLQDSGIFVVKSRLERPSPKEVLAACKRAGKNRLLLEGGGEFNASFLELGLVDQIHLTVAPILIGGKESPTWCEGRGLTHFAHFRLESCENVGGELYLTYLRA